MRRVHTFVPMESESERVIPELAAGSSKRDAEEELVQESPKRLKTRESSVPAEKPKNKEEEELSQGRIQQMMIIVPEQGMNVEALQTQYPIIDWEIYTKGARKYWKIIRVDTDNELWKLQKHIHDITWRLYDTCGVHHVSTKYRVDIYMLVEREYPLSRGVLTQMLVAKLLVEQDNEMSKELLRKIFIQRLITSLGEDCWELKVFILSTAKPRFCTAQVTTASTNQLVLLDWVSQLIMCGDIVKDSNSYLKSRGSIEDFVSFREMITSQLQGKLWLYDEVRTRLCLFCHHQIGEDCWDS
ncbi:hypothetical protein Tco_1317031 [Tanacetum coccineum]